MNTMLYAIHISVFIGESRFPSSHKYFLHFWSFNSWKNIFWPLLWALLPYTVKFY